MKQTLFHALVSVSAIFIASSSAQENSRTIKSESCLEIQSRGQAYLDQVNALFGTGFALDLNVDEVSYDVRSKTVNWGCNGSVMRPFHRRPECIYLLLGHELSHGLVPHSLDEVQEISTNRFRDTMALKLGYSSMLTYQNFHLNMNSLSAKMMRHFGIPRDNIESCERMAYRDYFKPGGFLDEYDFSVVQPMLDWGIEEAQKAYDEGWLQWSNFKTTELVCYRSLLKACAKGLFSKTVCDSFSSNARFSKESFLQITDKFSDEDLSVVESEQCSLSSPAQMHSEMNAVPKPVLEAIESMD